MKINFFLFFLFFFPPLQELLMSAHSLKYFMQVVPCISQAKPSKTPPSIYTAKKMFSRAQSISVFGRIFSQSILKQKYGNEIQRVVKTIFWVEMSPSQSPDEKARYPLDTIPKMRRFVVMLGEQPGNVAGLPPSFIY